MTLMIRREAALLLVAACLCAAGLAGIPVFSAQGQALAPGEVFRDCADCPEMVVVPAGRMTVRLPDPERKGETYDLEVTIAEPFAMGRYEVTYEEYLTCFEAGGCPTRPWHFGWGNPRQPVESLPRERAMAYADWLSTRTGQDYALPTATEWDYAARAGTETAYSWGDEVGVLNARCRDCGTSQRAYEAPALVGEYPPNPFGLYDMEGNVWEWVSDCYGGTIGDLRLHLSRDGSAIIEEPCRFIFARGGSYETRARMLEIVYAFKPFIRKPYRGSAGLRVVRRLTGQEARADVIMAPPSDEPPFAPPGRTAALLLAEIPGGESALRPGDDFRDCADCPEMVVAPAGSFIMGYDGPDAVPTEQPRIEVTIAEPYAIGKYEVTYAQYLACHEAGGCERTPPDFNWGGRWQPVDDLSWQDAMDYAAWLSEVTGKAYSLPSEAQWEHAARAGTDTAYWWGDEIGVMYARCDDCAGAALPDFLTYDAPAPVGSFPPNPFGLFDTAGNVNEWARDCWSLSLKNLPRDGSATVNGVEGCQYHAVRGGHYFSVSQRIRSSRRGGGLKSQSFAGAGIRLFRTLQISHEN